MDINELQLGIGAIGPIGPKAPSQGSPSGTQAPFEKVLQQKDREVKLSAHAQERLKSRNIHLDSARMAKLSEAIDKAEAKGAKDSLVLMGDTAYVVSVKNRTVITAVDGASLKDNVFTKIDSAVIV